MDVYSLLRFLRVKPYAQDFQRFYKEVISNKRDETKKPTQCLQAILRGVLLRRRKDTILDGQRLVELRDKKITFEELQFSSEELAVYEDIEATAQEKVADYIKAGV